MKRATHFIEQVKFEDGEIKSTIVTSIDLLNFAIQTSVKFRMKTIAIFKIYPKVKPMLVRYDFE